MSDISSAGMTSPSGGKINNKRLSSRIDALPASAGLWRFIALLSLGGFFELYDLFQTGYISSGLLAENIFHLGSQGVFGFSDQAAFASSTFPGLFIGASLLYAFFITLAYPLGSLICSRYADRIENKWQIVLSSLMTVIFDTLFALQSNPVLPSR